MAQSPEYAERDKKIVAEYNTGLSHADVARKMGLTKGQVCGALHRARLRGEDMRNPESLINKTTRTRIQLSVARKKAPAPKPPALAPKPPALAVVRLVAYDHHVITFGEQKDGLCRFPVPGALSVDRWHKHVFCGRPTAEGDVYCADCKTVAYEPAEAPSRRRKGEGNKGRAAPTTRFARFAF